MYRYCRTLTVVLPLLALAACSSSAVEVSTSHTPGVTLPAQPAFSITAGVEGDDSSTRLHGSPLLRERVGAAIEAELRQRRYRVVPRADADLVIRFAAGVGPHRGGTPSQPTAGGAYPAAPEPMMPPSAGELVIEMLHPDSGEVFWRGVASGLAPSLADDGSIRRAVRAVLAEFPPIS